MIRFYWLAVIGLLFSLSGSAQRAGSALYGHSHNDYERRVPFYEAYMAGLTSIEADIWLVDGELYVAHDREDIRPERTLRRMYLDPVAREMALCGGRLDTDGRPLQLLIDLKTDYPATLPTLVAQLGEYADCFDPQRNPGAVCVVVSGAMPPPERFADYPAMIRFDGRPGMTYDPEQLRRVGLMSAPLAAYSAWDGTGPLPAADSARIAGYVAEARALGLGARLWGCPDTEEAWRALAALGIDYLNTDRPARLGAFLDARQGVGACQALSGCTHRQ